MINITNIQTAGIDDELNNEGGVKLGILEHNDTISK